MTKSEKNFPFKIIFIIAVVIFILSQFLSIDSRVKILNIFRPLLKLISGTYYVLRDVPDFKEIINENKVLKENTANLEKEILKLQEFRLENQKLRDILSFREAKKFKFIPAMVIARDPLAVRDSIVVDKGKKDGVRKNMVVVSSNGLVGRVRESGWSISRVLLVTDCDAVVSGIIQRTRDEGAVCGNMRSGLIMKYLELNCDVKEGDKIVTSGFGGLFEKGILIGEVVSVEKDVTGLYLRAMVKPEVDMRRLEEVLVMR